MMHRALRLVVFGMIVWAGSAGCGKPSDAGRPLDPSGAAALGAVRSAIVTGVQVTVADSDGTPRAGQTVIWRATTSEQGGFVATDGAGQAVLSVDDGSYKFGVVVDGTWFWSGADGHCTVPACTSAAITVQKPVLVTVLDAADRPFAGKEVVPEDADGAPVDGGGLTDEAGQLGVRLPEGSYRFVVPGGAGVFWASGPAGHCAVPGCIAATIHVYEVQVTVVDGAGNPAGGRQVASQDPDGDLIAVETTDAAGQAILPVEPGAYRFVTPGDGTYFTSGAPGHCVVPGCTSATIHLSAACNGAPDGTACDDGDACTRTDTCQGGTCVGANPVVCAGADACHDAGTCDHATGACTSAAAKPNGAACDDGNPCTQTDTCQAGVCNGENPIVCVAQDACHDAGACDPSTGACSNPAKADGAACSDGDACTRTDTCRAGRCVGGNPVTCLAQDDCHAPGVCDHASGLCASVPKPDGTACDDGDSCTAGDACQAGRCAAGAGACSLLAIDEVLNTFNRVTIQIDASVAADRTQAVPGDVVGFTGRVSNNGMLLELGEVTLTAHNVGPSTFTIQGYKQTLEYYALGQQAWVPFASFARDNTGAAIPSAPYLAISPFALHVNGDAGVVTHAAGDPVFGTAIAPGATARWTTDPFVVTLTPAVENVVFDPAQSGGLRAVFHVDSSAIAGAPAEITGAVSATAALAGYDGKLYSPSMKVEFLNFNPSAALLAPASGDPLAPGASLSFTGTLPAATLAPRGAAETEAAYRSRLFGADASNYGVRATATGGVSRGGAPSLAVGTGIDLQLPILAVTKTGPTQGQAGFTNSFGVTLQNQGSAAAGPFFIQDGVQTGSGVSPVAATVTSPASVAAGQAGAAALAVPIPLDRPAGAMTDVASVSWQDRNGNSYGPLTSRFTTSVRAGLFQGEILLAGDTGLPDLVGQPKTLTATVLDPNGAPVPSLAVHLAITGPNARSLDGVTDGAGTAAFTYTGANKGTDSAVATATIVASPVSSNTAHVDWVTANPDVPACTGRAIPLDVLLVIDASSSMEDEGKIAAAKKGAKSFVDLLDFSRDQVGVESFAIGAGLNAPLNRDAAASKAAIDAITLNFFTNIGAALDTARLELTGPRHNPAATPVLVFLSDGGNSFGDPAPALASLKASGIRTIAIGLGSDIDGPALRGIASAPGEYFYAPSSDDLSWIYATVGQDVCRNRPPLVRAGGDQGAYEVRLPHELTLQGEVHDDGPPGDPRLTSLWTQVSGPAPVAFGDATSPVTAAVFTEPGTYVLELAASDGFLTSADRATITVDDQPSLAGASLDVALAAPGPLQVGATETLTATLLDAQGQPIGDFPLQIDVTGANARTQVLITDAHGVATFGYAGAAAGTDVLGATALGTPALSSRSVSVHWTLNGPEVATQGWIGAPAHQATLTGLVPITVATGVTLTSGTVTYWPASAPDRVATLASGVTGGPGAAIATLDTTVLANGPYVVRLDGTDAAGDAQASLVAVTVAGDYKPGRVVVEMTDFTIPLPGMPITIGRRYDSLERDNVGDFGHGWSLLVGHPRLEVDDGFGVTLTMLNGRRATFQFAPTFPAAGPVIFGFMLVPAYKPAPGVYGTLTANGCGLLTFDPFAARPSPICFDSLFDPSTLAYAPTTYTYTDPYGTVYTMGAGGELQSIKDRHNNTLTFSPNGILSSAGDLTVPFTRDGQGRITQIRTPIFDAGGGQTIYSYAYDGDGDLTTVTLPETAIITHTYDAAHPHLLATTKDPRGNMARTSTYDDAGRLASDTDAMGNVTRYAYDVAALTMTTTNPDSGVVRDVFDEQGMVLATTDPLGHTTRHTYDANRNELTRTNALGEVTRFAYDARGNQTSMTQTMDGVDRTTSTTYDRFSQPLTRTDALGNTTSFKYDDAGLPVAFSDSVGMQATFTSSNSGLPLTVTDAVGKTSYFTYDLFGNETSKTDRLGRATTKEYDGIGRLLVTTDPRGGRTEHRYNPRNTVRTTTDALGYVHGFGYDQNDNKVHEEISGFPQGFQSYQYDALNHLIDVEHADHTHTRYTRDFRGNPLTETDPLGRVTGYQYDLNGQLTRTTYADGSFTARSYDAVGRPQSMTDERAHTARYEYEPGCGCSERLTGVTDPLGRTTSMTYDANGRRTSITDAAGNATEYVYDSRGRLMDTVNADLTKQHNAYDARNHRISTTDPISATAVATTTYGYDDEGQLTSVTDPLQHATSYTYDTGGNLAAVTDANGHTTAYEYDLLGRKTKRTLPLGMSETYGYGPTAAPTARVDFRGKTTTMRYDALDRLLARIPDPSLGEPTESYTYTATGARASMTDASGTTTYTHDARDRVLTKAAPAGTLTYAWDAAGNLATVRSSNPNGTSVDYGWDEAGQLVSITDNRLGATTSAAYTRTGLPASLAQPNGVSATYGYNAMNRVTSLAWQRASGPAFASWSYSYNDRGQRLTSTEISGRVATYGYDAAARLTSEMITGDPRGALANGTVTYGLDAVGNRVSRSAAVGLVAQSFTCNANDELSSEVYDLNGNTASSGGDQYAYDFLDRLKTKHDSMGAAVVLTYDCDGNRVAKAAGGVMTQYLVDDLNPTGHAQVLEEVSGGAVQVRYTYGRHPISQTQSLGGTPSTTYYGYDARGNVAFLTDATSMTANNYEYDAWGSLIASSGTTSNTRLYSGEELDPDLGLVNLRARYLRTSTGRFLTIDPAPGQIGRPLTMNRYAYADDDPIDFSDPTGKNAITEDIIEVLLDAKMMNIVFIAHEGGWYAITSYMKVLPDNLRVVGRSAAFYGVAATAYGALNIDSAAFFLHGAFLACEFGAIVQSLLPDGSMSLGLPCITGPN
jgi:RHS repeat-associated protein